MTEPHGAPLELNDATERTLRDYLAALMEANTRFNLTAIRNAEDAWDRHILESASLVPLLGSPKTLIDVGSGGGLPGMVLAICRPDVLVTLLETTEKKARFLQETSLTLQLPNVTVVTSRAEVAAAPGSPLRESFDLVTARAVAPLRTLVELTLPFLRVGGQLIAVKGQKAQDELREARGALAILHGDLKEELAHPAGTILRIEKTAPTGKKYPRRSGEPKHRPL